MDNITAWWCIKRVLGCFIFSTGDEPPIVGNGDRGRAVPINQEATVPRFSMQMRAKRLCEWFARAVSLVAVFNAAKHYRSWWHHLPSVGVCPRDGIFPYTEKPAQRLIPASSLNFRWAHYGLGGWLCCVAIKAGCCAAGKSGARYIL